MEIDKDELKELLRGSKTAHGPYSKASELYHILHKIAFEKLKGGVRENFYLKGEDIPLTTLTLGTGDRTLIADTFEVSIKGEMPREGDKIIAFFRVYPEIKDKKTLSRMLYNLERVYGKTTKNDSGTLYYRIALGLKEVKEYYLIGKDSIQEYPEKTRDSIMLSTLILDISNDSIDWGKINWDEQIF